VGQPEPVAGIGTKGDHGLRAQRNPYAHPTRSHFSSAQKRQAFRWPEQEAVFRTSALALRDRRVYALGTPDIPTSEVRIYLDLEGAPDDGFVYLIGMIICEGATQTAYLFWEDTKDQEASIFEEFLAVVARYHHPRVYAYGGHERAFLKRMRRNSMR
jgi:predicted RecB family nuclease